MAGAKMVKARVLLDCSFGKGNDVVEVTKEVAEANKDSLDTHPDAVAYAEKLAEEAKPSKKK